MKHFLFLGCILLAACSRSTPPPEKTNFQVQMEQKAAAWSTRGAFRWSFQIELALLSIKYQLSPEATEGIAWDFNKKYDGLLADQEYSDALVAGKLAQFFARKEKENNIPATVLAVRELSTKYSVPQEKVAALIWDLKTAGIVADSSHR